MGGEDRGEGEDECWGEAGARVKADCDAILGRETIVQALTSR